MTTKPRVLLEGWQDQYKRMRRSRERLDTLSTYPEYDDAFYHAVQDAWHLKDWVKHDLSIQSLSGKIVDAAHASVPILIISDLANCTKHLVLDRLGAALESRNATAKLGSGESKRWFLVRLQTGAVREGSELLDEAIAAWDELLKRHRLL